MIKKQVKSYPAIERPVLLDPEGEYEEVYNRYAHITIQLVEEETSFELNNPDLFHVNLNIADLSTLSIKYIVSNQDLTRFNRENIQFVQLYRGEAATIYRVEYFG